MIQSIAEAFHSHLLNANQSLALPYSNFYTFSKNTTAEMLSAVGSISIQNRIHQDQSNTKPGLEVQPFDLSKYINQWNQNPKSQVAAFLSAKKEADHTFIFEAKHPQGIKEPHHDNAPKVENPTKENETQKHDLRRSSSSSRHHNKKSRHQHGGRGSSHNYGSDSEASGDRDKLSSRHHRRDRSRSREREKNRAEKDRQRQKHSKDNQKRYYGQDRQHNSNKDKQRYEERLQSRQGHRQRDRYYEARESQFRDERYVGYPDRYRRGEWPHYYRNESGHPQMYNQREVDNKQSLYQYYQQSAQHRDYYKRYG